MAETLAFYGYSGPAADEARQGPRMHEECYLEFVRAETAKGYRRLAQMLRDEVARSRVDFKVDELSQDAVPWIRRYREVALAYAEHLDGEARQLEAACPT